MRYVDWNSEKNEWLKQTRGVSFESVIEAALERGFLAIFNNPGKKYAHQIVYLIELHEYAYMVPSVVDEEKIFLKTIIPSRKYTKQYIEKGDL